MSLVGIRPLRMEYLDLYPPPSKPVVMKFAQGVPTAHR